MKLPIFFITLFLLISTISLSQSVELAFYGQPGLQVDWSGEHILANIGGIKCGTGKGEWKTGLQISPSYRYNPSSNIDGFTVAAGPYFSWKRFQWNFFFHKTSEGWKFATGPSFKLGKK